MVSQPGKENVLLKAAGVEKAASPKVAILALRDQMISHIEAMLGDAEKATLAAQNTQQATVNMFESLENFCKVSLPKYMKDTLNSLAVNEFKETLSRITSETLDRSQRDISSARQAADKSLQELKTATELLNKRRLRERLWDCFIAGALGGATTLLIIRFIL